MASNWGCVRKGSRRLRDEGTYAEGLEEVLGVLVDVEHARLGVLGEVEGRDLGDVLVLALALLFLELERDTADGTTLDTLHQVSGVTGDLDANQNVRSSMKTLYEGRVPCCAGAWRQ